MVNRYHVNRVIDIRNESELDATFDHAPDEIIGVRDLNMAISGFLYIVTSRYSPAV